MTTTIDKRADATMRRHTAESALTLFEALVIISIMAFGLLLVVPVMFARHKDGSIRVNCASNLKQVALAFRIWEGDNGDKFPAEVFTNESGAPQFTNVFRYYQVMSNELNNPMILVCPLDRKRRLATNFTSELNDTHVSYFMGLNADAAHPQSLLAGDANVEIGGHAAAGFQDVTGNRSIRWNKERHRGFGYLAFADGSVQQFSNSIVQKVFRQSGLTTNKLLFP